jgi:septal ring factor EnvC (AmiA/AmiB activator)
MRQPFLTVLLAGSLLAAATVSTLAQADDSKAKRAELEQLNRDVASLKKLLSGFRSERSELQQSLRQSELDIGNIQRQIRNIAAQLNTQQAELKDLQERRATLQDSRKQQQNIISQQVLAAYQIGQQKKLKVLFNQQEPDKLSRSLAYYDYFNRARSEQINSYIDLISELNSIEPRIQERADSLAKARSALSKEHHKLRDSQQSRQQSLRKINAAISDKDKHLKQLELDRRELEQLIEAVEQTIANIAIPSDYSPFDKRKGKLAWPVNGKPSNRFGSNREGGKLRWQGVTIPAPAGSEIKAIHHGRVVFADWLRGAGLLIIVDHGDGYMSLYGHNQSLLADTGDWVSAGDSIATVGNSGGQQRSALYFEIRHNGKPTDPVHWCRR